MVIRPSKQSAFQIRFGREVFRLFGYHDSNLVTGRRLVGLSLPWKVLLRYDMELTKRAVYELFDDPH